MIRLLLVVVLLACDSGFRMLEPLPASDTYRKWHKQLERCSGLHGDFDLITFRSATQIKQHDHIFAAYWQHPHTITIQTEFIYNKIALKHEMMHDLLQSGEHPPEYFIRRCGDLMHI